MAFSSTEGHSLWTAKQLWQLSAGLQPFVGVLTEYGNPQVPTEEYKLKPPECNDRLWIKPLQYIWVAQGHKDAEDREEEPQHSQGLPVIHDSEILQETAKDPWQEWVSKYFSVPQA